MKSKNIAPRAGAYPPTPEQLPVFEYKGKLVADSREVATLIDRPHYIVLRTIRAMVSYYRALGMDSPDAYRFHPCTTNFELVDESTFAEVLYPETIFDIIDFHARECVRQEIKFRICKNCGKYFAVTGHAGVEYCDRVINKKGQTCKEIGAFRVWEKNRSGNEVFRLYRREYKKRFAWIKAGRIEPDAFYAWSEKAREKKAECETGKISFEEFSEWLSMS